MIFRMPLQKHSQCFVKTRQSIDSSVQALIVKSGAINEDKDKKGLAHLVEHIICASNEATAIMKNEGRMYASTDIKFTSYTSQVLSTQRTLLFDFLRSFQHTVCTDVILQKEKENILLECKKLKNDRVARLKRAIENLIWAGTARSPIGTPSTINAITKEDVTDFLYRHYATDNVVIVTIDNNLREVKKKFRVYDNERCDHISVQQNATPAIIQTDCRHEWINSKGSCVFILLAFPYTEKREIPPRELVVLTNILTMASRDHTIHWGNSHGGDFQMSANLIHYGDNGCISLLLVGDVLFCHAGLQTLAQSINSLCNGFNAKVIIHRAYENYIAKKLASFDNPVTEASHIAYLIAMMNIRESFSIDDIFHSYRMVKSQHITDLAIKLFRQNNLYYVGIGPYSLRTLPYTIFENPERKIAYAQC